MSNWRSLRGARQLAGPTEVERDAAGVRPQIRLKAIYASKNFDLFIARSASVALSHN